MCTNLSQRRTAFRLELVFLVSLAGCFSTPSPDIANRICTTDQQCPVGYSCLAPGKVGGCCKPGALACPVPVASDGASLDIYLVDLRAASEATVDTGNGVGSGTVPGDAPLGVDQATGMGGFGGSTAVGVDGSGTTDGNTALEGPQ
jgi:hypothetical protein